jgi:hypothetical protein
MRESGILCKQYSRYDRIEATPDIAREAKAHRASALGALGAGVQGQAPQKNGMSLHPRGRSSCIMNTEE